MTLLTCTPRFRDEVASVEQLPVLVTIREAIWQFEQPDGSATLDHASVTKREVNGLRLTIADMRGEIVDEPSLRYLQVLGRLTDLPAQIQPVPEG